jgi:hypothetical protein
MKILHLRIRKWRNLRDVSFAIAAESTLVCLVGENGTGKSNVLELASAVAHLLGLSPGIQMSRGNPFDEVCDVEADLKITNLPQDFLGQALWQQLGAEGQQWDGRISVRAIRHNQQEQLERHFAAGGVPEAQRADIAQQVIGALRQRQDIHHLYLDSDRSYPPIDIHLMHFAEALQREWDTTEWKKNRAFLPTRDLYDDWIKYFLAQESQHATRHIEAIRLARRTNQPAPEFDDPFVSFRASIEKVLPHLIFQGADLTKKSSLLIVLGHR